MNLKKGKSVIHISTMQMIALGFLGVILLGAFLLWLPISNQQPITFVDALFTSVTSVCVTGLVTIVPATQFTVFGKFVLLVLIQIGGLGVIACTVAFLLIMRRQITIRQRARIQEAYGLESISGLVSFMKRIIKGTLFVEGIGAVLYMICFIPVFGFEKGYCYGIFHAVSAFCNAGIDIIGTSSLMEFVDHPLVNFTTMFLIISGGLGFTVWYDVLENFENIRKKNLPKKRLFTRLELHSKLVLVTTAVLILGGTILFYLLEFRNPETLGNLAVPEQWMAAMFQSVTTRTAGFATLSQDALTDASKLIGLLLMLIGGSPAGTAGGIKTTTVAMLFLTGISVIRGRKDVECFGRKIPQDNVKTGITVILAAVAFLFTGLLLLCVFEPDAEFVNLMYEAVSAIATVGLSANLTAALCTASKIVLMCMMYIGRLGPITIALVFGRKVRFETQLRDLPEKRILVG